MASVTVPKTAKKLAPKEPVLEFKLGFKQPETIQEWVKEVQSSALGKQMGSQTPEGDLMYRNPRDSQDVKVIVVPKWSPATSQTTKEFFETRLGEAKEPEERFASARRYLNRAMAAQKAGQISAADILGIQQQVRDADCEVSRILKMPRSQKLLTNVEEGDLTLDWYDRSKEVIPVGQMEFSTFPVRAFWQPTASLPTETEVSETETKPAETAAKPKRQLTAQQIAILRARRAAAGK